MDTTEKRPVGRPARDPYADGKETIRRIADVQGVVAACNRTAEALRSHAQYIYAALEDIKNRENMDDTARIMAEQASKRLYFVRHFFPEYMISEYTYMCEQLEKLQAYLDIHLPQKQEEE